MSNPIEAFGKFVRQNVLPLQDDMGRVASNVTDFFGNAGEAVVDVGGAVVEGAMDVAAAVADTGVATVAVDVAKHNLAQVGNITAQLVQRSPHEFVDWFIGPQGPSFADFTAQVPGLQTAFGDIIDTAMANPMIAGAAGRAFGFEYVPGQDFYTTNESSIQSVAGFHDVYDKVGDLLGMDLDDRVVTFESGGVEYRLELWKGSYGSGGAFGGEIGLYTRHSGERGDVGDTLEQIPGYYSAAAGEDQIASTQTIYNAATGQEYFTNTGAGADDGKHFWNLAIRTDPGVNHEDIGQKGTLVLATPELAETVCAAMNQEQGVSAEVLADGLTVSYDWP